MSNFSLRTPLLILFLVLARASACNGGGSDDWLGRKLKPKSISSPNPKPSSSYPSSGDLVTFNVLHFGAKGNGLSDDTKAFQAAWGAACAKKANSMVLVPSNYTFLVAPISFPGPCCQPKIVFQIDGTIIAPTNPKVWGKGSWQWLLFTNLNGTTIQGSGVIDGQGTPWWKISQFDQESINSQSIAKMPSLKPTALRFYKSYGVVVTGITIQNSPQFHLKFDNCVDIEVFNFSVWSPEDSPNTDGIHLQNTKDVVIHQTNLACGDDCVSIQTGCSNVSIYDVNCGPGHGISIGGLGKKNSEAWVSNITVQNATIQGTSSAVRIKTWQGGSGSVQGIKFSNITVSEVKVAIVIDQYYCDKGHCKNQSSAVAISDITYENIKGTYTMQPVSLACSDGTPCSNITMTNINLEPVQKQYHILDPFCWRCYGESYSPIVPPVDCLTDGNATSNWIHSYDNTHSL